MIFKYRYLFYFLLIFSHFKLISQNNILTGSERIENYIDNIRGKKIAIVCNNTSLIKIEHIVDKLISLDIDIDKIFTPEHGFWLKGEAGELIKNDYYKNIKVVSLYGKTKKIKDKDLENIDLVLFDIQDVGVRFYTYISTLHYVMESCSKNDVPLIVLDKPNPNISYVDGPVLDTNFRSFVGMHPVPIVYGMTIGEYAKMIKGEGWVDDLDLMVVACSNYDRKSKYVIKHKPSPNLPNKTSIKLYPSLCLFEGTNVSVGRGTDAPFQIFGSPFMDKDLKFRFVPKKDAYNKNPKHKDKECFGIDLRDEYRDKQLNALNLQWLIFAYQKTNNKDNFFNNFFDLLAGNSSLRYKIIDGYDADDIKKSWQEGLESFKIIRKKYLIY